MIRTINRWIWVGHLVHALICGTWCSGMLLMITKYRTDNEAFVVFFVPTCILVWCDIAFKWKYFDNWKYEYPTNANLRLQNHLAKRKQFQLIQCWTIFLVTLIPLCFWLGYQDILTNDILKLVFAAKGANIIMSWFFLLPLIFKCRDQIPSGQSDLLDPSFAQPPPFVPTVISVSILSDEQKQNQEAQNGEHHATKQFHNNENHCTVSSGTSNQSDQSVQSDQKELEHQESKEKKCPICFEVIQHCCALTCGHVFCVACIEKWLSKNHSCPVCRCMQCHFHV